MGSTWVGARESASRRGPAVRGLSRSTSRRWTRRRRGLGRSPPQVPGGRQLGVLERPPQLVIVQALGPLRDRLAVRELPYHRAPTQVALLQRDELDPRLPARTGL